MKQALNTDAQDAQTEYRNWTESRQDIPVFLQWWWIDTVTHGQWSAVFSRGKNGEIRAAMAFPLTRLAAIFQVVRMPKQTQFLGPWVDYPSELKPARLLSFEKQVFQDLIEQLPPLSFFRQRFHCSVRNWLPFYWSGFDQSTLYTYRLDLRRTMPELKAGLQKNTRYEITRASRMLQVHESDDIDGFYKTVEKTFARQSRSAPFSLELARRLDAQLAARGLRRITRAEDDEGRTHAAIYMIRDAHTAYYLWSGSDLDLRRSGANALLLWDAIEHYHERVSVFDFEGSMIEPIEHFFRSFGGEQTPYFVISKASRLFQVLHTLRKLKS